MDFPIFLHLFRLFNEDHEKEVDNRTVELEMLRERRGSVQEELQRLDQLRAKEAEDYKAMGMTTWQNFVWKITSLKRTTVENHDV